MTDGATLVWFRNDFRQIDNLALNAAAERGNPVIPVYAWAPQKEQKWALGSASRWWLHHSLVSLSKDLERKSPRLLIRSGESFQQLSSLIQQTGADAVFWNRRYEPVVIERDENIKTLLRNLGTTVKSFNRSLLFEPWQIQNQTDQSYKVFTPF